MSSQVDIMQIGKQIPNCNFLRQNITHKIDTKELSIQNKGFIALLDQNFVTINDTGQYQFYLFCFVPKRPN